MPEPTKIPRPFADSGDKNSIPDSSGSIGFASWQEGFPAITGTPFAQGGVAPKRKDFNGILNALSAATVWNQQGGVYAYDNATDYEVGNVAEKNGSIYICKTANGPGSSVKDPSADTAETYWGRLYPQNGTFNRMFYSQTSGSYTAPGSGVYRVTLKGGGGGGGGSNITQYRLGAGGGEGGELTFYVSLTAGQSYPYVIGAGGTAGTDSTTSPTDGGNGGTSSFNAVYTVSGGNGGNRGSTTSMGFGGAGGLSYSAPAGAVVYFKPGIAGQSNVYGDQSNNKWLQYGCSGGGRGGSAQQGATGIYGGGGRGTFEVGFGGTFHPPTAGGAGYILIEYAG